MRHVPFLLIGIAGLVVAAPEPRPDPAAIARLVAALGGESYAEREDAMKALDRLGSPALEALRQATRSEDPEVRRRAAVLVQRLEKRQEADQLLAPQRVRWVFKDTPVTTAVAEIAKQTGFKIEIAGDRSKLADRKFTLDTGETGFWQAFDRFCSAAGLLDVTPPPAANRTAGGVSSSVVIIGGNRPAVPSDITQPASPEAPPRILLADGTPQAWPTHYAGKLRIRALPPGTAMPGHSQGAGELLLALEVMAEPGLVWQQGVDVRVQQALDDKGQSLVQLPARASPSSGPASPIRGVVVINGVVMNPADYGTSGGHPRQVAVKLKPGPQAAMSLRELTGTIAGQVQTPPQPLVTVNDVLRAAERTVKGAGDSSVHVKEVVRQEDGQVKLRIRVEPPPRKISDGSTTATNMTVIINGQVIGGNDAEPLSARNFALLDSQGKPFQVVKATNTGRRDGTAQELELTYQPGADQGPAARFVFTARRSTIIDVPFTLKDVRLR